MIFYPLAMTILYYKSVLNEKFPSISKLVGKIQEELSEFTSTLTVSFNSSIIQNQIIQMGSTNNFFWLLLLINYTKQR